MRRGPMRAVVIVGPVHSLTSRYLEYGREMADAAEQQGMEVTRIFFPNATKDRVKKAANGANLLIYAGHGNGWPSAYGPFQERTKNGLGLNPIEGPRTTSNVHYYGADWLRENIQLAPDAVVILSHLSYASGNASSGMPIPSLSVAVQRVDNFANGFLDIGARTVWALGWQPGADVIRALANDDADDGRRLHDPLSRPGQPAERLDRLEARLLRVGAHAGRRDPHRPRCVGRLPARGDG